MLSSTSDASRMCPADVDGARESGMGRIKQLERRTTGFEDRHPPIGQDEGAALTRAKNSR